MAERPAEREQRVTPLELFFDLVAIWWLWTGYAWLTNVLEPEEGLVRAGIFGGMAAMFLVALAVPIGFGRGAVLFGIAYLIVRVINLALYAYAARNDPDVFRRLWGFAPAEIVGQVIIVGAAFAGAGWRTALWV